MALTAQQIRQMFSGTDMSPNTVDTNSFYQGVLPSMGGGNAALNAYNAAASTPPQLPAPTMAYAPQPRTTPALTAATTAGEASSAPVSRVSGAMKRNGPLDGLLGGGGLLSLLTGPSKNNMPGLAGFLGGPEQGGLLQMLFGGNKLGAKALPMKPPGALTPAQKYALANSGPGSVAAMEAKHSGRPAGSYTDGREPSGTGSLW